MIELTASSVAATALPLSGADAAAKVFLDYTQDELDRAYDQRVWAPDSAEIITRYAMDSAMARVRLNHRSDVDYGSGKDETLDFFHTRQAGAPIHIFVHGGAWRLLTKDEAAAAAPCFVDAGVNYIALNFSAIPHVRLPDMVEQIRRAVVWTWQNAQELGADPNRITMSGHSSGGHLAGVVLTTDWARYGAPADILKGGVCLSGMFELKPVMLSRRSSYVKISDAEIGELSAMRHLDRIPCPVIVGYGERESPEFKRQSREFADALRAKGKLRALFEMPGLNHFEVPEQLNRPDTPLARAVLDLARG